MIFDTINKDNMFDQYDKDNIHTRTNKRSIRGLGKQHFQNMMSHSCKCVRSHTSRL